MKKLLKDPSEMPLGRRIPGVKFGLSCDTFGLSYDTFGLSCDTFGLSCDNIGILPQNYSGLIEMAMMKPPHYLASYSSALPLLPV